MDRSQLKTVTRFRRRIRDPIHRYVKLTVIENALVDTSYFARLGNIAQMHSAHLVYPGATYSRKTHSLGAMEIAHRVICNLIYKHYPQIHDTSHPLIYIDNPRRPKWMDEELEIDLVEALDAEGLSFDYESEDQEIANRERDAAVYIIQMTRLAALLHDIGHGPMSHLFEYATRASVEDEEDNNDNLVFDHEEKTKEIITTRLIDATDEKDRRVWEEEDAEFIGRIIDNTVKDELTFLHQIISSALDADKMDYLMRDAYYTGTREYGTIDLDRLIEAMVIHEGKLLYSSASLDAIVQALNAMFFMFNNVYLHKTVRAFDLATLEGLSNIRDFIARLPDNEELFRTLDDKYFFTLVRRLAHQLDSEGWNKAAEALQNLSQRNKTYRLLVDERASLPVALIGSEDADEKMEGKLESLKSEIQDATKEAGEEYGVRLTHDLEKAIHPIGLKPEELAPFVFGDRIFDVEKKEPKPFKKENPYYKTLLSIVIPLRVFISTDDQEDLEPDDESTLKEELSTEVSRIIGSHENEWRKELDL